MMTATTTTTTSSSMIRDTVEFDDIFHELNEDLDSEAKEWSYLNNFYLDFENDNGYLNPSITFQGYWTSLVSTLEWKMNANLEGYRYFYDLPDYLWASESSFQTAFFSELRGYKPLDCQLLQHLCMLAHQVSIIHLHEQLWHCILQMGQGQLKQSEQISQQQQHPTDHTPLSFWPDFVTFIMKCKGIIPYNQSAKSISQDLYIHFVQNYLDQLAKQARLRRMNFDMMIQPLFDYANGKLNEKIEDFLQKEDSLRALRHYFERRITLLTYICIDRTYQLAYFQQQQPKPTHLQLQIAKQVCSLTFDKEKAQHELMIYTFPYRYRKLSKSVDILENSPPTSITTISNSVVRQRLSKQYQEIIQRTKDDLMSVFRFAASAKKDDAEKKFDKEIAEIWTNQRQQPAHERLTPTMLAMIEQRQKNVIECVKRIYELKDDFYMIVPPRTLSISH